MATGLLSSSISICKTCTCNQSSYICHFIDPAAGSGWGSKRITKTRHCLSFLKIWQNILTAKKKKKWFAYTFDTFRQKPQKRSPKISLRLSFTLLLSAKRRLALQISRHISSLLCNYWAGPPFYLNGTVSSPLFYHLTLLFCTAHRTVFNLVFCTKKVGVPFASIRLSH